MFLQSSDLVFKHSPFVPLRYTLYLTPAEALAFHVRLTTGCDCGALFPVGGTAERVEASLRSLVPPSACTVALALSAGEGVLFNVNRLRCRSH